MAEAAFGVQLRSHRQAAGLSLRQLATRVGYDHSYLSQVERGQRPGSVHLARLCDRALATDGALTAAFHPTRASTADHHPTRATAANQHATTPARPAGAPGAAPPGPGHRRELSPAYGGAAVTVPLTAAFTASGPRASQGPGAPTACSGGWGAPPVVLTGGDPLEALRHGLTGSFGAAPATQEWSAVTAARLTAFPTTPPAELLPELTTDLQLLQLSATPGSTELAVPAAELGVLMALTLTAVGRSETASRWWRTARQAADVSGHRWIAGQTRSWEVLSTLGRPPAHLLALADQAVALADHPRDLARALAARAQVLALLGRADEARRALHDLPASEGSRTSSLFDWSAYEVHEVQSFVHTVLRDTASAYVAVDRALTLCPTDRLRDRAALELRLAECLVVDGDVSSGLSIAMRALVELPDQWHTQPLYDAAARVLAGVRGADLAKPAVRDYRVLLRRRPFTGRSVGSGSSTVRPGR